MPLQTNLIFNYLTKTYEKIIHKEDATCEDICIELSKKIGILPPTRLLYGLRIVTDDNNTTTTTTTTTSSSTSTIFNNQSTILNNIKNINCWLTPCRQLKKNYKYEFRIRYKIPQLTILKKIDEITYNYYYHQVRYDLVNDRIDEIKYPKYKDDILGLGVVDMYIDMIEYNLTIDQLEKNYKKYIPKELIKNHHYFAKKKIHKGLKDIKKKDHDLFYVKGTYLESIKCMAPKYLIEEYHCNANYLPEDNYRNDGTCPVIVQVNPFDNDKPGLKVFYKHKNEVSSS